MGAWGPGPFNSDDGLELAAIVEHSEFSAVRKRLKFDRDDDADCAHAYAAAAIVAASQGHRVAEFPLELDKPLAKFRKACQRAHVDQAINALETIKKDSALKQLWKESPSAVDDGDQQTAQAVEFKTASTAPASTAAQAPQDHGRRLVRYRCRP